MSDSILSCRCRYCGHVFPYISAAAGGQMECPICYRPVTLPGHLQAVATRRKVRSTSLPGLALEVIGFALLMLFPIGTITGVVLIVIGYRQSYVLQCGNCEAPLPKPDAAVCPKCRAVFVND